MVVSVAIQQTVVFCMFLDSNLPSATEAFIMKRVAIYLRVQKETARILDVWMRGEIVTVQVPVTAIPS
jgi:hypothetical protein